MLFENHEIDIDSLPKVESGEFTKLDSNYLVVRYIGSFIFFVIVGFGLIGSYLLTDLSDKPKIFWGLVGFWILWALTSFILTTMGYKIRGYRLRDKDLIHRKGVIFKRLQLFHLTEYNIVKLAKDSFNECLTYIPYKYLQQVAVIAIWPYRA